jgi:hypothetical protein
MLLDADDAGTALQRRAVWTMLNLLAHKIGMERCVGDASMHKRVTELSDASMSALTLPVELLRSPSVPLRVRDVSLTPSFANDTAAHAFVAAMTECTLCASRVCLTITMSAPVRWRMKGIARLLARIERMPHWFVASAAQIELARYVRNDYG